MLGSGFGAGGIGKVSAIACVATPKHMHSAAAKQQIICVGLLTPLCDLLLILRAGFRQIHPESLQYGKLEIMSVLCAAK
jgi:hypothetical protein